MNRFIGKTILITGAAGGIGQSLCRLFAQEGGRIAALDRSDTVTELVDGLILDGFEASAAIADISSFDEVSQAIASLRDSLGTISVLVNNAGYSSALSNESTSVENWHADINLNLNGAFHCSSIVLQEMKALSSGVIINIASVNGLSALGDPAYSAAKSGLISYTKSVAMEYGCDGIRANVICPGTVRTPIWQQRIEKNPGVLEDLVKWYPLQRIAEPEEIAKPAIFLASEDASAITGAVLPVDCGLTAGNIVMTRELTVSSPTDNTNAE